MIKLKTEHNRTFRGISVDGSPLKYLDFIREAYALRNAFKDSGMKSKILITDTTLMLYYQNEEIKQCIDLIRKVSSESNASARSNPCNTSREEAGSSFDSETIGRRMAGEESGFKW